MFVRFAALALIGLGLLDVGLYLAQCFQPRHPLPVKLLPLVLNSAPGLAGIVVLARAKAIAEWLANKFD